MNNLSFARKVPPEMPQGVFRLPNTIDLVLDCTSRVAGSYNQGDLKVNIHLSPNGATRLNGTKHTLSYGRFI
jgi:hypothetical protein